VLTHVEHGELASVQLEVGPDNTGGADARAKHVELSNQSKKKRNESIKGPHRNKETQA